MKLFEDENARLIYETRFGCGAPEHVSVEAHEVMHLLVAARSLQDVAVIDRITRWKNAPDLYGLHVHGKWYVVFIWYDDIGARQIRLARR